LPHPRQNSDNAVASANFAPLQLHCKTCREGINTCQFAVSSEVGLGVGYWG
jgi:hypothetical protein